MSGSLCQHARVSERADSDDFLGWAPDIGFWDAPTEASVSVPTLRPVVPPPASQPAPVPRSAPARPPARTAPPAFPHPQGASRLLASKLRVPVLVAAAVMLVFTFFTALTMASSGPGSSPVMLGVFVVLTALLGRVAWGLRGR